MQVKKVNFLSDNKYQNRNVNFNSYAKVLISKTQIPAANRNLDFIKGQVRKSGRDLFRERIGALIESAKEDFLTFILLDNKEEKLLRELTEQAYRKGEFKRLYHPYTDLPIPKDFYIDMSSAIGNIRQNLLHLLPGKNLNGNSMENLGEQMETELKNNAAKDLTSYIQEAIKQSSKAE